MKRVLSIIFICLALIAIHVMAHASGYGIFTQGARGLGRANASIASLDSPSGVFFNPALISELDGTRGEVGTTLIFPDRSFSGSTGADTEDDFFYPTTLYLSHELNDELTFGLGIFNPFGLGTDWPDTWEGRYLATRSEIVTYDIRPVIAWQVTPNVSIAAGIDYVYLDAELEGMIDFTWAGPNPDGHQLFAGDGDNFGYNFGLALQLTDQFSFGLAYRSEIEIDVDARATFTVPPAFSGLFPNTAAKTEITLPQQLSAGIAWQASPELLLEASLRWEDWTSFDRLLIQFDQPVAGSPTNIQPRDWDDTFTYSLGGEYRLDESTILLAGYLYGDNPVPDTTFEPAIPDSDTHLFCFGLTKQLAAIEFTASYGYQHQVGRTKNNAIVPPAPSTASGANGEYESDLHLVGFSLGYKFK